MFGAALGDRERRVVAILTKALTQLHVHLLHVGWTLEEELLIEGAVLTRRHHAELHLDRGLVHVRRAHREECAGHLLYDEADHHVVQTSCLVVQAVHAPVGIVPLDPVRIELEDEPAKHHRVLVKACETVGSTSLSRLIDLLVDQVDDLPRRLRLDPCAVLLDQRLVEMRALGHDVLVRVLHLTAVLFVDVSCDVTDPAANSTALGLAVWTSIERDGPTAHDGASSKSQPLVVAGVVVLPRKV